MSSASGQSSCTAAGTTCASAIFCSSEARSCSAPEAQAAPGHLIGDLDQCRTVLVGERIEQAHQVALVDRAQHAAHGRLGHLASAVRDGLVGQRQRIAHRALRGRGQQAQRIRLVRDALLAEDAVQVGHDVSRRHLLQVELQAARQHRDGNLLRIGGREDELDVLGRFSSVFNIALKAWLVSMCTSSIM